MPYGLLGQSSHTDISPPFLFATAEHSVINMTGLQADMGINIIQLPNSAKVAFSLSYYFNQ